MFSSGECEGWKEGKKSELLRSLTPLGDLLDGDTVHDYQAFAISSSDISKKIDGFEANKAR